MKIVHHINKLLLIPYVMIHYVLKMVMKLLQSKASVKNVKIMKEPMNQDVSVGLIHVMIDKD